MPNFALFAAAFRNLGGLAEADGAEADDAEADDAEADDAEAIDPAAIMNAFARVPQARARQQRLLPGGHHNLVYSTYALQILIV